MSTPYTKSISKVFALIASFKDSDLATVTAAANTFITGTLDSDADNYYNIEGLNSYYDGTNHVIELLYKRWEISLDAAPPEPWFYY